MPKVGVGQLNTSQRGDRNIWKWSQWGQGLPNMMTNGEGGDRGHIGSLLESLHAIRVFDSRGV